MNFHKNFYKINQKFSLFSALGKATVASSIRMTLRQISLTIQAFRFEALIASPVRIFVWQQLVAY